MLVESDLRPSFDWLRDGPRLPYFSSAVVVLAVDRLIGAPVLRALIHVVATDGDGHSLLAFRPLHNSLHVPGPQMLLFDLEEVLFHLAG